MGETDIHQIIIQIVIYNEDNKGRSVGSYKEIWSVEVGLVNEASQRMQFVYDLKDMQDLALKPVRVGTEPITKRREQHMHLKGENQG